jgi:hypothetical protein
MPESACRVCGRDAGPWKLHGWIFVAPPMEPVCVTCLLWRWSMDKKGPKEERCPATT